MSTRLLKRLMVLTTVAATAVLASPADAQDEIPLEQTLQVTTDFPAVTAEAGDSISFDIEVFADALTEVSLEPIDAPDGWDLVLRGGGFVIDGVTAAPDSPPRSELEVTLPPDTAPGPYHFGLRAQSDNEIDILDFSINVADRPVGGILLSTDFATLRGRPTDTFRYDLEITNQTPEEITFAFDAAGPPGWTVTAGPASEQRASTVTVAAGESESVRVEADPPTVTPAGSYDIVVTATGGGQSGSFQVTAEVTGQASIELVAAGGRLDLSGNAGDVKETTVLVVNDGSAPLEDIQLVADEPAEWTVEFEPDEIASVGAGESREVTVRIQPAGNAVAGDYAVGITARSGGETSDVAYRFAVQTSRWWGAIGVAIIVASFIVLFAVFRRFGRR